ncbi:MAG TPA: phosphatase PAP2 family protein [Bryobacteraceae bacterium]|nr:phosphatase PAP2 family protein [Bryobacteraceae bacterium]
MGLSLSFAQTATQNVVPPGTVDNKINPLEDPRDRVFYPGDTERVGPLAKKVWGNFLLDQKEIWTSPFHMNRHNAKWWILFGGATGGLIAADHYLENRIEHSSLQTSVGGNISQAGELYTLLPATVGLYAYGVIADDAKPREVGVLGGQALLDSLVVMEALKLTFGRQRPSASKVNERSEWFDGGQSFPSGHAIMSWTLASVIAHEYQHTPGAKWVPYVAYGIAGTVSVARWAAMQHYPSDIVAGGAMGWFIGRYVYQTHKDHAIHRHEALVPQFVPAFSPETRTYGAALNWGGGGEPRGLTLARPIPVGGN